MSVRRRREHDDHQPEDDGVEEELAAAVVLLRVGMTVGLEGACQSNGSSAAFTFSLLRVFI